ncbi:MAG: peptidoglycan bridge formation glycyltransferase FemA/FemB family protein [Clostridia bacterium]
MPVLDKSNQELIKKYENFVKNFEGSNLMQSINWSKVKNNWDFEAVYVERNGNIVGSMLILIQKIPFKNYTFMYSPRGPVCNINNLEIMDELLKEVDILAKKYKAFMFKFDPAIKYDESIINKYKEKGFKIYGKNSDKDKLIQPLNDAVLDIDLKTEELLLKNFTEKTRYNIRLSLRKGVEVYYSNSKEDLKTFYEIYKVTTIRDNIGCRPFEYFERMLDAYSKDEIRIYIAKHENDKLSAAIATNYGSELFYLYGASSNIKRNLMPNYAMQWEMIKWGLETGCKKYNFGGILNLNQNNGLYKFKIGFCKVEGIIEYIGEINKVYNKFVYFIFAKGLPIIKKIKRQIRNASRKINKKKE